jgi:hypothetical protein
MNSAAAQFITGLLVFSALAVCPGLVFREHYFVLLLPAIALAAGAAVADGALGFRLAAWALFAAAQAWPVWQQRAYLFNMAPSAISRAMYGPNPFPEAVQVADFIRSHSAERATVAVLGSEPEIPFYARRRSATGYIYTYELMKPLAISDSLQGDMIGEIEAAKPEFIVLVGSPMSWLQQPGSPRTIFIWSEDYLNRHYAIEGSVEIGRAGTEYRWGGDAVRFRRMTPSWIEVFRRLPEHSD